MNRLFSLWRRDPILEPAISDAVARSSSVFRTSVFADRIVAAASRLLGAAAACAILLSFATGHRKSSYWSGCIKDATVICQQIFLILALVIFLVKFLLKSASKFEIVFFRFGVEIHPFLELQFPTPLRVVLLCFTIQCLQIALQRLRQGCLVPRLHAQYYCLLQLDIVNRRIGVAASMMRQWFVSRFFSFGADDFPCKFILKVLQIVFLLWRQFPSGFGAAIPFLIMYKKASLCKNFFL